MGHRRSARPSARRLADAEEVAQDALTYALTKIDRYDPNRASFATWLNTITISRCRNKRRRRYLVTLPLFSWLDKGHDVPDQAPLPEQQSLHQETQDEVWQAIQRLSQPLREAILLRHWADYTYQEIADMLFAGVIEVVEIHHDPAHFCRILLI